MKSKTTRAKATTRSTFGTIMDDILYLVLDEIELDRKHELLSFCLVSQRFYILGTPYLYRDIDFNLTKRSHTYLLRRLTNPQSKLAERIKCVSIAGTNITAKEWLPGLCVLLRKTTYLKQLEWKVCMKVPGLILQTLAVCLPKTNLIINTRVATCNAHYDPAQNLITRFDLSAGTQLTQFCFRSGHGTILDSRLKAGLVEMLTRSPVLQTLIWHECHTTYIAYPEKLHEFAHGSFPPLKKIFLCSRSLFTSQELHIWARRGGWRELTNVKLIYPDQVCALIGHAPKLQEISFFTVADVPLNMISARLQNTSFDRPFGGVLSLRYQDTTYLYNFGGPRQVVPWCMLEVMPGLEELALQHAALRPAQTGPLLPTPTAGDIRRLRNLQPHLVKLCIDISMPGLIAKWPQDVLNELALFQRPIHLSLFLHSHDVGLSRSFLHGPALRNVYRDIVKIRKSRQLPCQLPFKLSFKVVRTWSKIKDHYITPDVSIWSGRDGSIRYQKRHAQPPVRRSLEWMTKEELVAGRVEQHFSRRIGWDRTGYEKELLRRQRMIDSNTFLDLDSTLWERWAS